MTRSIVFISGMLASLAAPLGAQESGPSEAPVPFMQAFSSRDRTPSTDADGRPLLRRAGLDAARREIPAEVFPSTVADAPNSRVERVQVIVSLDPAGTATACRADGGEIYVDRRRTGEPVPAQTAAQVCALAMAGFGYHPALGHAGHPVGTDIALLVEFGWRNYWRVVPSAGPRRSEVVSLGGWPATYLPDEPVTLVQADPVPVVSADGSVGLLLTSDGEGAITTCQIVQPSGMAELDAAACGAIAPSGQKAYLLGYPVMLEWRGNTLRLVAPVEVEPPLARSRATPEAAMIAGAQLPENAVVRFELTVSPEGRLAGCEVIGPSYVDALDIAACRLFGPDARFTVPRGNFAEPVSGRMRYRVDWNRLTLVADGW